MIYFIRIYIIDNIKEINNIHTERLKKYNLKPSFSSFIWHYRLDHINEKCMKLHKTGDLGLFDYKSFETYKSYLLGKMTNMLFNEKRHMPIKY